MNENQLESTFGSTPFSAQLASVYPAIPTSVVNFEVSVGINPLTPGFSPVDYAVMAVVYMEPVASICGVSDFGYVCGSPESAAGVAATNIAVLCSISPFVDVNNLKAVQHECKGEFQVPAGAWSFCLWAKSCGTYPVAATSMMVDGVVSFTPTKSYVNTTEIFNVNIVNPTLSVLQQNPLILLNPLNVTIAQPLAVVVTNNVSVQNVAGGMMKVAEQGVVHTIVDNAQLHIVVDNQTLDCSVVNIPHVVVDSGDLSFNTSAILQVDVVNVPNVNVTNQVLYITSPHQPGHDDAVRVAPDGGSMPVFFIARPIVDIGIVGGIVTVTGAVNVGGSVAVTGFVNIVGDVNVTNTQFNPVFNTPVPFYPNGNISAVYINDTVIGYSNHPWSHADLICTSLLPTMTSCNNFVKRGSYYTELLCSPPLILPPVGGQYSPNFNLLMIYHYNIIREEWFLFPIEPLPVVEIYVYTYSLPQTLSWILNQRGSVDPLDKCYHSWILRAYNYGSDGFPSTQPFSLDSVTAPVPLYGDCGFVVVPSCPESSYGYGYEVIIDFSAWLQNVTRPEPVVNETIIVTGLDLLIDLFVVANFNGTTSPLLKTTVPNIIATYGAPYLSDIGKDPNQIALENFVVAINNLLHTVARNNSLSVVLANNQSLAVNGIVDVISLLTNVTANLMLLRNEQLGIGNNTIVHTRIKPYYSSATIGGKAGNYYFDLQDFPPPPYEKEYEKVIEEAHLNKKYKNYSVN